MNFLVTGAGRGIGLEFVRQLLSAQKSVFAWVRDPSKATDLAQLQKQHPQLLTVQKVDINDANSVTAALQNISALDVVINNAGVYLDKGQGLQADTIEQTRKTFEVNVYTPMRVVQATLPLLQKSPSPLIVNISSLMGSIADNSSGSYYGYRMSKTALNMFTKSLSVDYPKVKTLCMHPGWVQTDMGGSGASVTPEKSVNGLLRTILEPQKYATGSFINFEGKNLPW